MTAPTVRLLADRVRVLRAMQGLSQEELAERASLHRTYIGAVERAERNITLKVLEQIAKGLDVEPEVLIGKDFNFPRELKEI